MYPAKEAEYRLAVINTIEAASTKRLIPILLIFSVSSLRGFMILVPVPKRRGLGTWVPLWLWDHSSGDGKGSDKFFARS